MRIHSLSASKISTYKECNFKYYLGYHLGIDSGTNFAAENGSMIHEIFENIAKDKMQGRDPTMLSEWYHRVLYAYRENELWKLSNKAIEKEKKCETCQYVDEGRCTIVGKPIDKFKGCPKDIFNDTIKLVEKIINDKSIQNPLNKKIINVEDRFEITIEDGNEKIPVTGFIDIINELDKNTIEINDYKTGTKTKTYQECLKDPQLMIYHLAAKRTYKNYKNILVTIIFLRKEPITVCFNKSDEIATEASIKKYWYEIKNNVRPKRRCDNPDGSVTFDYYCKYLCDIKTCEKEYSKFVNNGYHILPEKEIEKVPDIDWLGLNDGKFNIK